MDFKDKQPIYQQIADHICDGILQENWKEGDRIPSVRELAVLMEVNPHTILRSYEYLQNKNIIFNKRGVGYSVAVSAKEQITNDRRARFIEVELPLFLSTLKLLNISIEEVNAHYEAQIDNQTQLKSHEEKQ